jgi:hypothetical protein
MWMLPGVKPGFYLPYYQHLVEKRIHGDIDAIKVIHKTDDQPDGAGFRGTHQHAGWMRINPN